MVDAKGYIDAADMAERGSDAGDELPKADKLAERVEPGALWLDGGIGPVKVPKKASDLARPGWAVTLTLAKVAGEWRILEVGNVYP